MGRMLGGAFLARTGIAQLWATMASSSPDSLRRTEANSTTLSRTCPSCGTCLRCDAKTWKCKETCEPCAAALLCSQAQQSSSYTVLNEMISTRYNAATEPQALLLDEKGVVTSSTLMTLFTSADPTKTATVLYAIGNEGPISHAVEYVNGVPRFGYSVDDHGVVQQTLPPYQVTLLGNAAISRGSTLLTAQQTSTQFVAASRKTQTYQSGCGEFVKRICKEGRTGVDLAEYLVCLQKAVTICLPGVAFGYPFGICFSILGGICVLRASIGPASGDADRLKLCESVLSGSFCTCPGGQEACGDTCCGACQECQAGACVPKVCGSGYHCSATTGVCACDHFSVSTLQCLVECTSGTRCGSDCCGTNATCVGGEHCICPSDYSVCMDTGGALNCCPPHSMCVEGQCVETPCNGNEIFCGGGCCGGPETPTPICCHDVCFPAEDTCCASFGACYPGTECCEGPVGAICCPSGSLCCRDSAASWCCDPQFYVCGSRTNVCTLKG